MNSNRKTYKRKYPLDATERICRICNVEKPINCFPPNRIRSDGYVEADGRCYDCRKPEKSAMDRLAKYGITDQEFQAMLLAQSNRCAICQNVFKTSKSTHVDHCHNTGRVRGLLCHDCNTGIGKLRDSVDLLQRAIDYLR